LCPLHAHIDVTIATFEESLSSMTLQDIVAKSKGNALCQSAPTSTSKLSINTTS
jgi:DNA-binding IscR family transcriptional regulator